MDKGIYYSLRPWHFKNGASFPINDFKLFQYYAQRWQNCKWMYALLIIPPVWIILAFAVFIPRANKMKQAANNLGILQEKENAIALAKAGQVSYQPSQAEIDNWNRASTMLVRPADAEVVPLTPEGKKKHRTKVWGIVLLSLGVFNLILGIVIGIAEKDVTVIYALGAFFLLFAIPGLILILVSNKKNK